MIDVGKVLEGIAILLWPIIVIILIFLFKPAVAAIIESAKSRKFTLKIGGQELTMEEVNKQQREMITDIQSRIIELEHKIKGKNPSDQAVREASTTKRSVQGRSILWVDDNPKNNSYFVQQLLDKGLIVDLALSTSAGLERFNEGQYSLVISDMGRTEKGSFKATAGLELFKEIRAKNPNIPFVILTTSNAVRQYASEAKALGVTLITSSPTELFAVLLREFASI